MKIATIVDNFQHWKFNCCKFVKKINIDSARHRSHSLCSLCEKPCKIKYASCFSFHASKPPLSPCMRAAKNAVLVSSSHNLCPCNNCAFLTPVMRSVCGPGLWSALTHISRYPWRCVFMFISRDQCRGRQMMRLIQSRVHGIDNNHADVQLSRVQKVRRSLVAKYITRRACCTRPPAGTNWCRPDCYAAWA